MRCITKDIILIAVTANGFEEDKQQAIDAGFNQFLIKPPDPAKLTDILRETLQSALEQTHAASSAISRSDSLRRLRFNRSAASEQSSKLPIAFGSMGLTR